MTSRAVFRADAAAGIGSGHFVRCATLAGVLVSRGWTCTLVGRIDGDFRWGVVEVLPIDILTLASGEEITDGSSQNWDGVDLLVVDHYGLGSDFESACRPWAKQILAIDDLADRRHDADFLLDQTYGRQPADYRDLTPAGCRLLLGTDFALLRGEFSGARSAALDRRRRTSTVERIFVSTGSSDPRGFVAVALEAVSRLGRTIAVDVVVASVAPTLDCIRAQAAAMGGAVRVHIDIPAGRMIDLMTTADLAIGAGGIASWERCCLGLPTIAVVTAENQWPVVKSLSAAGAIDLLGSTDSVGPDRLADAIAALAGNAGRLRDMAYAASVLCDGMGAARVASRVGAA